ncbi:MAG: hypothetical protein SPJ99_03330 [Candidatus Coprenecus sp.]|nr:hypothetical protein [Candidatus Coprenecus sp.]
MKEFYEMSFLTRMKKSGKQKRRGRRENTIPPIVPNSLHFIKKPGPDCLDGMVLNQHGGLSETVALYREIPDLMYFDKLSSAWEPKSATWAL